MNNSSIKEYAREWLPPLLVRRFTRFHRIHGGLARTGGYTGNYASWEEARHNSDGYDDALILERVRAALARVRDGQAAYERDGVVFDRVQHAFPLLTALLLAAGRNAGRLNVLDFGGSLGSSYFQCRGFLEHLASLRWNVVEQPNFVVCGQREFAGDTLAFYNDVDTCLAEQSVNVLLLSGVLPYVDEPHALLSGLAARQVENVIIDRTPLFDDAPDRLTVQLVPAAVYGRAVSYPAWILNHTGVVSHFAGRYRLWYEFDALAGDLPLEDTTVRDRGFFFTRAD